MRDGDETRYRDELNFAEFPLAALSSRPDGQPYLTFSDTIFDQGRGQHIVRKVTISPSAKHGLPTPMDAVPVPERVCTGGVPGCTAGIRSVCREFMRLTQRMLHSGKVPSAVQSVGCVLARTAPALGACKHTPYPRP